MIKKKFNKYIRLSILIINLILILLAFGNKIIMQNRDIIANISIGYIALCIGLVSIVNKNLTSFIKEPDPNLIQLKTEKTIVEVSVVSGVKAVVVGFVFLSIGLILFIYNLLKFVIVIKEII
jgi:hypothetical protein